MFKGGKWLKMDFHLHTPDSDDYGKGSPNPDYDKSITPEDYLKKCMSEQLDCIAITDHNSFGWISNLRSSLDNLKTNFEQFRPLTIFPGIELNVQGNIHVLAIFDHTISIKSLYEIFGKYDYDRETLATRKSIIEVIDITFKNGGILIPAHVDEPSGLFKSTASIIKQTISCDHLLAMEANSEHIENTLYRESKKNYTLIRGSDSHSVASIGSKFTWVKMGEPSIDALKLALHDSDDGVRRSLFMTGNPNDISDRVFIKSLSISNGKIIGRDNPMKIDFSPWLTTIIGGRGTGKSSIVEYLRVILNKGNELPKSLDRDFSDFMKVPRNREDLGMLKDDTLIKLEISKGGIDYNFEWESFVTYEINRNTGEREEVIDFKERFPIILFSQKQLYEVSKSPEKLFDYLDSSWDSFTWKSELLQLEDDFKQSKNNLRALLTKLNAKKSLVKKIDDTNLKLALFESESIKTVLREKSQLADQEKSINRVFEKYQSIIDKTIDFYMDLLELDSVKNHELTELDEGSRVILNTWRESVNSVIKEILVSMSKLGDLELDSASILSSLPWQTSKNSNEQRLNEVIEDLKMSGVENIENYPLLLADKELLEKNLEQYSNVDAEYEATNEKADKLLEDIYSHYDRRSEMRETIINQWNEQQAELKVEIHPYADSIASEKSLRRIIGKELEYSRYIADRDGDKLNGGLIHDIIVKDKTSRVEAIKEVKYKLLNFNDGDFSSQMRVHLTRLFEENINIRDEFNLWMPTDKISLLLKKEGTNRFESIDAGSAGQRSSALLSLLLRITEGTFIVDQPEDDLDTLKISDLIVTGVNEIKKNRQVVFVTHNPNIVVNTNSEQVNHMDFVRGQIQVANEGALQCFKVRDAICRVMEGGKTAFDKRYYRISKALSSK